MSLANASYLRICLLLHIYQAAAVESFDRPPPPTPTPLATLEKCICHLQCALITRKITTLVWWPTNRAQIHANIGAIASSSSSSSQLRDLHAECERGPTNQLSLVQLSSCSLLLLVLHHLLCSCVQLHSAHSQLPFAVLNLVRLHRQRQRQRDWQSAWLSHYATVWLSGSLTIWQFWLLGFRATQAASLCAPVAACNLQLPVHTNLPLSNLLATAAAASPLAVVVAPKCTLLFFKSQQADDNNTSWN